MTWPHWVDSALGEKSFRMAKSDLQARPIYHHLRDSIEAHLTLGDQHHLYRSLRAASARHT